MNEKLTYSQVKDYYGKVLQTSDDLKTDACCTDEGLPDYLKPILSKVHDEVLMRYYGCVGQVEMFMLCQLWWEKLGK